MLTEDDFQQIETRLEKKFVTKEEFKTRIDALENSLVDFAKEILELLGDFRQEMNDFKQEFKEFRIEMRDIVGDHERRLDKLEDKVFS